MHTIKSKPCLKNVYSAVEYILCCAIGHASRCVDVHHPQFVRSALEEGYNESERHGFLVNKIAIFCCSRRERRTTCHLTSWSKLTNEEKTNYNMHIHRYVQEHREPTLNCEVHVPLTFSSTCNPSCRYSHLLSFTLNCCLVHLSVVCRRAIPCPAYCQKGSIHLKKLLVPTVVLPLKSFQEANTSA